MSRRELAALLEGAGDDVVREVAAAWLGKEAPLAAVGSEGGRQDLVARMAAAMSDEARVVGRVDALPERLARLLERFLEARTSLSVGDLFTQLTARFSSRCDLEACLAALQREGFLLSTADGRWTNFQEDGYAVPAEVERCIALHRQRSRCVLREVVTLKGFLDTEFFGAGRRVGVGGQSGGVAGEAGKPAESHDAGQRAQKIYKLYTLDAAIARRRASLPDAVAKLVEFCLSRHGGLVGWSEIEQLCDSGELPDAQQCKAALEANLLGTVTSLEWARYGLEPIGPSLVMFHEVAVAELRRYALAKSVDVDQTLRSGANMASNVVRFLRELQHSKVPFTAQDKLFKTSRKRIAKLLAAVPGSFLEPAEQLDLLCSFCLQSGLIGRQEQRLLRPTASGQEFERSGLLPQVGKLLTYCIDDRSMGGEAFHQVRLRRLLLKWMRLLEPMRFEELAWLPYLARSTYVSQLDEVRAAEHFAARFTYGGYRPTETLRQMCWNLLDWVKRRLYPLGLVDIGLRDGRPVAMRLSSLGAEVLATESASKGNQVASSLLVNPDYEIVLFPGDDEHQAVYEIDRFARRLKSDHVHQFVLQPETVRSGLQEGLTVAEIVQSLNDRARAPVPQNVLYSLEEWGR